MQIQTKNKGAAFNYFQHRKFFDIVNFNLALVQFSRQQVK